MTTFQISNPPSVVTVSAWNADGVYRAGSEIILTVVFDAPVEVTGTPTLQLETGSVDRVAIYDGKSGELELRFKYVVHAGDESADLNYLSTNSLRLDGAAITASGGSEPANIVLPALNSPGSLASSRNIVIDTAAPRPS